MAQRHDLTRIANLAKLATIAFVILQFAFSAFLLWDNHVYAAYLANESGAAELAALSRLDALYLPVSLGFIAILLTIYAINGRWIYLASSNAAIAAPSEDRIRPGWAVGWFVIPIANLWMPYKAMKQTWAASVGGGRLESETPTWFTIWWISWIGLGLSDQLTSNMGTALDATPQEYMNGNLYTAISGFLWIIPAVLFIRLINEVTAAQRNDADVFA